MNSVHNVKYKVIEKKEFCSYIYFKIISFLDSYVWMRQKFLKYKTRCKKKTDFMFSGNFMFVSWKRLNIFRDFFSLFRNRVDITTLLCLPQIGSKMTFIMGCQDLTCWWLFHCCGFQTTVLLDASGINPAEMKLPVNAAKKIFIGERSNNWQIMK